MYVKHRTSNIFLRVIGCHLHEKTAWKLVKIADCCIISCFSRHLKASKQVVSSLSTACSSSRNIETRPSSRANILDKLHGRIQGGRWWAPSLVAVTDSTGCTAFQPVIFFFYEKKKVVPNTINRITVFSTIS